MAFVLNAVLIDHHDSFTYNIKAWLKLCFNMTIVDYETIDTINPSDYDLIVLSPGPKTPSDYPKSKKFLLNLPEQKPVVGICLGMQLMNEVAGGHTKSYSPPLHGKTSLLKSDLIQFNNINVARYHSLYCLTQDCFSVLATSHDIPMIIKHKKKNWLGFQFHPESFLCDTPDIFLQTVVKLCTR